MRICFIANSSLLHVKRIVSHFTSKKDDVLLISTSPHKSVIAGTHTIHLLNTNKPYLGLSSEGQKPQKSLVTSLKSLLPIMLNRLIKDTITCSNLLQKRAFCVAQIQRFDPEVIYCFRSFPEGVLASHCHVRPLLLRTAGPDISKLPRYPVYKQVIRKVLQTADVLVTESLWERKLLQELCGDGINPKVIIIGVDTTLFQPHNSREAVRDKYGLPRDAFVIVSNRPLEGHYNGWMVVKAIQSILEQCPNLALLYNVPYEMRIQTKTNTASIAARFPQIKFLEGPLPHAELKDVLGCGDIYISFSSFDGIPNSLLEAMACGLVPIAAELPQLHEWIKPGVNGYFVSQHDTKGLATIVRYLYKHQNVLPDMSVRCVSKILERGSYEECMQRTRDLLNISSKHVEG